MSSHSLSTNEQKHWQMSYEARNEFNTRETIEGGYNFFDK